MVAKHRFTHIDMPELKEHIFRKIGSQRAEKYFNQLNQFFAMKLSKAEFDRTCIVAIGRENLRLHNKLILSILQNTCQPNVPSQKLRKHDKLTLEFENVHQSNCWSHISRARKSPLGPLGKSSSLTCKETFSIGSRSPVIEEGEEVEQSNENLNIQRWAPITAPIGVSVNLGRTHKGFDNLLETCENRRLLPDTRSLRRRLQKKLASEGVEISMECVDLLTNSLDEFLKRLIEPCIVIACSRRTSSFILGGQYGHSMNCNNEMLPEKFALRLCVETSVSMLDFRLAMESNPRVLGEDWPLLLEKICHYGSC